MQFGLSELQVALRDSVDRFLTENCDLEAVRQFAEPDAAFPDELWRGLVDLGISGIAVPESFDGAGMGTLEASVVSESMGKFAVPLPFDSHCVIAPKAIESFGNEEQKTAYLPAIASGELRVGIGLTELSGARGDNELRVENGKLNGSTSFVTGPQSHKFLVADTARNLHLVDADAEGLAIKPMPHVDRTRRLCHLSFNNVNTEPLLHGASGIEVNRVLCTARVLLAADSLGAAQEMLDRAVAYAMERRQFNRVIASFQAVKHMCAEMAAEIEPARSLVWYAAHAQDESPEEAELYACHAKAHLAEVSTFVARTATVVHGGMGFTDLLGLHYWFKRIGYNRQLLGGPERVREEAARVQGLV